MKMTKISLFGTPSMEQDGIGVSIGLRKAVALIAYLAVTNQNHSRDALAALLWPDSPRDEGRSRLRRLLHRVKDMLGDDFIRTTGDAIFLKQAEHLQIDVRQFQEIATTISSSGANNQDTNVALAELRRAADLYSADFLAGFSVNDSDTFEEWQRLQKETLRRQYCRVLSYLCHIYSARDDLEQAIFFARELVDKDPINETSRRLLMRLYARAERNAEALQEYEKCRRILTDELGVEPDRETSELYEAVKKGKSIAAEKHPQTHFVESGGVHIAYQIIGDGNVDLLIIGGFISHLEHIWEQPELARFLRDLGKHCRLIIFDKRGVGLSDRIGYAPTLENTASDVAAVLNAAGATRAFILGISEGGPAGITFAVQHPGRVRGLILYGTLAKGSRSEDHPWALTDAQYDIWQKDLINNWGRATSLEAFAPNHAGDQSLRDWWAKFLRLGSSPGGLAAILDVARNVDVRDLLPAIDVPTLVLHRKHDQAIRFGAGAYVADKVPNARLIELEGNDHWWWFGDTEAVLQEIAVFMREQPR